MKTAITKGLNPKEAEEVEADFRASQRLRERLITLLEEKMRTKRASVRQDDKYENANWAYLQADYIGYERGIFEIISLLSSKNT
jgi:hypothetical protein